MEPKPKTKLRCACGEVADLKNNPNAWDGWQVTPKAVCRGCIQRELSTRAGKVMRRTLVLNGSKVVQ